MWTWWYNWIIELWINYKQNVRAYQPVYKYSKSDERHFHAQYERQNLYSRMWLLLSTIIIRKIVWVKKKKEKERNLNALSGRSNASMGSHWTENNMAWYGGAASSVYFFMFLVHICVSIVDHFFHLRSNVHCQLWPQLVRHERSCNAIFFAF